VPRFERIEDRRFWEIHVDADGRTVHSRAGLLGSDGRPSARKTWPTKKAAAAELKARITEQLGKGYVKCPEWDEPATPQLLAGIAANPAVADGYLVYADWLQQKRHPRGELIALQSARGASGDKKLLAAEAALLEKYPKLAPPRCTDAARKVRKKHPDFATTVLRWENGFIASARLAHFFSEQNFTIRELLVELLEHPAGRFLRRLELGIRGDVNGVVSYVDALAELARLAPPSLRSLSVVEAPREAPQLAFSELGPLDAVLAAMPSLETLQLAGQNFSFGKAALRGLKHLVVVTTEPSAVQSLVDARFPALESLELDCGENVVDPAALATLSSGAFLPSLKHLALVRTQSTELVVQHLAKSALLPKLKTLSLAGGTLSEPDALTGAAFAHLERLDVSANALTAQAAKTLASSGAKTDAQRVKAAVSFSVNDLARLSQDSATFGKARALATPKSWARLGREPELYWGECEGSELYAVTFRPGSMEGTCSCPGNLYRGGACKHVVALAMLATSGHAFKALARPNGFG
jgi:uncharacterized protein (TIGR02996 family)